MKNRNKILNGILRHRVYEDEELVNIVELIDFKIMFVNALRGEINKRRDYLLEKDLNEGCGGKYYQGHDKDFVDVGVGSVCVRDDVLQDEEQAFEDAKDELIEELKNADYETFYSLIENENVLNAIIELMGEC